MSNDFSNNPFAVLQDKVLSKSKPSAPRPKVQEKSKQEIEPDISLDDKQLFLQAVHNAKASKKQANRHTPLAEYESFGKLGSKGQVGKKKKNPPKVNKIIPTPTQDSQEKPLDDDQAFFKAMQEVTPLNGRGRDIVPEIISIAPKNMLEQNYEQLMESQVEFAHALKGEYLECHVLGLDEAIMNSLRAGQYSPEAHLDLHGLNAVQAYHALVSFFRSSWYKSLRTVLVVPGRGKNSDHGFGVLRDKLQTWLTQEPFKRVVLAFCTARPVDGGPGSVYVLLRKYKKKGKIQWERLPSDPDLF